MKSRMSEAISIVKIKDEAAWQDFAMGLAPVFQAGDCVFLVGDLGVGKTSFARALIRCLLQDEDAEVASPTFSLVQIYEADAFPIWHMDLYRLEDEEEIFELGVEEAFDEALCLIEWPQKAGSLLPSDTLTISIEIDEDGSRKVCVGAPASSEWAERLDKNFDE